MLEPSYGASNGGKAKAFFRANPSGAFDQYCRTFQKLPLIKDPLRNVAWLDGCSGVMKKPQSDSLQPTSRFVTPFPNLRQKVSGHGLDLSELVAIGNEGLLKAVKKFDPDRA